MGTIFGKKFVRNIIDRQISTRQETRDGIVWDIQPAQKIARVKLQGSNQLINAHYPENWEQTPFWLKPGNCIKIFHTGGVRGRIEIKGHGLTIPTPVSGDMFPTIATPPDALLTPGIVIPIPSGAEMNVIVKVGSVRINGNTITLTAIAMDASALYELGMGGAMGEVAGVIAINAAPSAGLFRIDLIEVGADGVIDYTAGTASATPVAPTVATGHVQLATILVPSGTTEIDESNINKDFIAITPSLLNITIADDVFSWSELSTTITVQVQDQYNNAMNGTGDGWYISLAFESGNGTLSAPNGEVSGVKVADYSGSTSQVVFTYTRDQVSSGDVSPSFLATLEIGTELDMLTDTILLLDHDGASM